MTQDFRPTMDPTRRGALAGIGLAGIAATLAACGGSSSSDDSGGSSDSSGDSGSSAASSSSASSGSASSGGSSSGGGTALGSTSEIPVGGGKIYTAAKVVVTQPTRGQYNGFSAVCTHVGCIMSQVANGTIDCPCHGSEFKITNGAVVTGPAPSPLPAKQITVADGKVVLM